MTTYFDAKKRMFQPVIDALTQFGPTTIGYVPAMLFQDIAKDSPPDGSKVWTRIGKNTLHEAQSSLGTNIDIPGGTRYTSAGVLWVQFFVPRSDVAAVGKAQQLGVEVRNKMRRLGDPCVWLRNASLIELAPEVQTIRFNITAEYEYSEVT